MNFSKVIFDRKTSIEVCRIKKSEKVNILLISLAHIKEISK